MFKKQPTKTTLNRFFSSSSSTSSSPFSRQKGSRSNLPVHKLSEVFDLKTLDKYPTDFIKNMWVQENSKQHTNLARNLHIDDYAKLKSRLSLAPRFAYPLKNSLRKDGSRPLMMVSSFYGNAMVSFTPFLDLGCSFCSFLPLFRPFIVRKTLRREESWLVRSWPSFFMRNS